MDGEKREETTARFACDAGTFEGWRDGEVVQVRAIRYATSERYGEPVPYRYPEGVHEMRALAPFAAQNVSRIESMLAGFDVSERPQEESCQYLSITLPAAAAEADAAASPDAPAPKLPVMVWIHGGAFRSGGCDEPCYDRRPLVTEGGVIVVNVSYRLGVLGFLRDRDGNFANLGLLDLIEALRWVRHNIAAFGGDPDNVTIFGQSAGGEAVRCIILAVRTDDLYRRAIIQSDPIGTVNGRDAMERKKLDEFNTLPVDAPIEDVLAMQATITDHVNEMGLARFMSFGPHYGVWPLPDEAGIAARLREVAPTHDLIMGCTTREVAAYVGVSDVIDALDFFPLTRVPFEKVIRTMTHLIFTDPSVLFAQLYAECGGRAFFYLSYWMERASLLGACHASELPLLFGGEETGESPLRQGLSSEEIMAAGKPLRKRWTDFARDGSVDTATIPGILCLTEMHA